MRSSLKVQRGITFLHMIMENVKNDPILHSMFMHMQEPWFHLETENFEYRSRYFPLFMKHQYLYNHDLPVEFEGLTDNDMLLKLMHEFIWEEKLKGHVKDVIENPENYEKEYMMLTFKFFKEIEAKLAQKIALENGKTVDDKVTLYFDPLGELQILTLQDTLHTNEKLDLFNEFAGEDLAGAKELLEKEKELDEAEIGKGEGFSKAVDKTNADVVNQSARDLVKVTKKTDLKPVFIEHSSQFKKPQVAEIITPSMQIPAEGMVEFNTSSDQRRFFGLPKLSRFMRRPLESMKPEEVSNTSKSSVASKVVQQPLNRKKYMADLAARRKAKNVRMAVPEMKNQKEKSKLGLFGKTALISALSTGGLVTSTYFFM